MVGDEIRGKDRQQTTEGFLRHMTDFGFCPEMKSLASFDQSDMI